MKKCILNLVLVSFLVVSVLFGALSGYVKAQTEITGLEMVVNGDQLEWYTEWTVSGYQLRIILPDNNILEESFADDQIPVFSLMNGKSESIANGLYGFRLVGIATGTPPIRNEDQFLETKEGLVWEGIFRIENGRVVIPSDSGISEMGIQPMDLVTADDHIVTGSLCVGFDCVNNESFGFDTIRLKENNTRIKFDDTSATAGFPATDWQLTANDSASGGLNRFSIEDITNSKNIFTLEANAPTNSLYVDDRGNVGLGTSNPILELHLLDSDTPAIRMDQDSSGGFTAQIWDVAGNEANFFIRDVTGGSRLPFRIRPGTPTNTLTLIETGYVGIGTWSPEAKLHVIGNAIFEGYIVERSDEASKENFSVVDAQDILAKLAEIPITSWNYIDDAAKSLHIGPMAQDFYAAFGLGMDDKHLGALDVNGVNLAAIQELNRQLIEKDEQIEALETRVKMLETQSPGSATTNLVLPMAFGFIGLLAGAWLVRKKQ